MLMMKKRLEWIAAMKIERCSAHNRGRARGSERLLRQQEYTITHKEPSESSLSKLESSLSKLNVSRETLFFSH